MKYLRGETKVNAVQWNGQNVGEVLRFLGGLTRSGEIQNKVMKLGELVVAEGAWIVREGRTITIEAAESFATNYREAT